LTWCPASPPSRSLYWSPKSATTVRLEMYLRVPDLYSIVVQVGAAAQCRQDGGDDGFRNRCPAAGAA
jgi:hypothetical protein